MTSNREKAAADPTSSLPDEWVDAGNLQRFIDDWERLDPDGEHASLLDDLRRLLPTPPTMGETEWDNDTHVGLVARHKHGQMMRMLVPSSAHMLITCVTEDGKVENYRPHNLTPLEGTKINLAPAARHEATPRQVQDTETVFDPAYIYTDRDGDEWEYLDGRWVTGDTHTERVAERKIHSGLASLSAEYGPYRKDRLVPESAKQDDEKVLDPAYTYRDKDGDTWEFLNHNWLCADYGRDATNYLTPPAKYGPYTRIEKEEASE